MNILSTVESLLPTITDYSYDKILRYSGKKNVAIKYPYLRVNEPEKVSFLVFDIDKQFVDNGLTPSFTVVNPENQHCHAFYVLKNPVIGRHSKAWKFMNFVSSIYKNLLDSDRALLYQRLMVKNPFNEKWQYVPMTEESYTLVNLYKQVQGLTKTFGLNEQSFYTNFSGNSRNCAIFDRLRKSNLSTLNEYLDLAEEINPQIAGTLGKPPLDKREIIAIARSVWNYKQKVNKNKAA